MIKKIGLIALLFCIFVGTTDSAVAQASKVKAKAPSSAQGVLLWQSARLGMTKAQILSMFPDATLVNQGSTASGVAQIEIPSRDLLEHKVKVEFYFQGNRLETVSLSPVSDLSKFPDVSKPFVRRVVQALEVQYRTRAICEADDTDTRQLVSSSISCDLRPSGREISVYYIHLQGRNAVLDVSFRRAVPASQSAF